MTDGVAKRECGRDTMTRQTVLYRMWSYDKNVCSDFNGTETFFKSRDLVLFFCFIYIYTRENVNFLYPFLSAAMNIKARIKNDKIKRTIKTYCT